MKQHSEPEADVRLISGLSVGTPLLAVFLIVFFWPGYSHLLPWQFSRAKQGYAGQLEQLYSEPV